MENLFEGNNWDNTRNALLEGLEGTKRDTMSAVLENTKVALNERVQLLVQHRLVTSQHLTK